MRPTLSQRYTWKRMVGITLEYAGFVGLRAYIEPTLGNFFGPMRKITSSQRDFSAILPTLAQRIFAVWEITDCVLSPNFIQNIISVFSSLFKDFFKIWKRTVIIFGVFFNNSKMMILASDSIMFSIYFILNATLKSIRTFNDM